MNIFKNIIKKIFTAIPKSLAGVAGIVQAIIKFVKELLTLIVNILYPIIPSSKFQAIIDGLREVMNVIDSSVEKVKDFFLEVE